MYLLRQLLVLYIYVGLAYCFFGRRPKDGKSETKTHKEITINGTLDAISKYIVEYKGAISIEDFFKNDGESYNKMMRRVNRLGNFVSNTQADRRETAYYHCNANQIELAHNLVKSCTVKLKSLVNDIALLRRQIGECLYTVQSFYSNTNWIEMSGETVYYDFGTSTIMAVASGVDNPCEDMDGSRFGCENNIIINNKLTSGYHSGRGNEKPARSIQSTVSPSVGPCSHGGPHDDSRKLVAKCGINKDSVTEWWSPHYHLHGKAYRAAVKATEHFLIGSGTGVLHTIGQKKFDRLFHIKTRDDESLAFAVDFSGSMSDDIAAVKKMITELVFSTMGSANGPTNYVLSLFNDPESLHADYVYTSGFDMINEIKSISANGGGDCPEYAAAGILKAIDLAINGSTVLVFTDASAKDEDRASEVITAASTKDIKLIFLLTGTCSKRKKREIVYRRKRAVDSFYQQLADETGGEVYNTNKNELDSILSTVLEGIFPTSEIMIDSYIWFSTSDSERSIQVDDAVTVLKISVTGSSSASDVDISYPNETIETFNSTTSNRIYTDTGETIISIQNPPPGTMKMIRNVNNNWNVNITGQSSLKADVELLQYTSDGNLIDLQGSPVLGNNYSVSWTVYNLGNNGTCDSILTVFQNGTTISSFSPSSSETGNTSVCSADIDIPEQEFKLKLNGTDSSGYPFSRKISTAFQPSFVELTITAQSSEVVVNQEAQISHVVRNVGGNSKTYQISITDSHGFVLSPSDRVYTLDGGESANGTFTLKPTASSIIISYTINVTDSVTGEVQHSVTKKLVVTDIERPACSIIDTTGMCEASSLNTANCSKYEWSAVSEIKFSGTELQSISSTAGSSVTLDHENITNLLTGPLTVNITGDCCYPNSHIHAIDVDGFIAQCELKFANDEVRSVEVSSTKVKNSDATIPVVAIVGAVVSAVVVATIVIIGRYYYNRQNMKQKVKDLNKNEGFKQNGRWNDMWYIRTKPDNIRKPVFTKRPGPPLKSTDMVVQEM